MSGATLNLSAIATTCPSTTAYPGNDCRVTYEIDVQSAGSLPCWLNGTYTLSASIICDSSIWAINCPLQGDNASIVFNISSGNLCGQFSESYGVTAALTTWLSDYSTQRDAFLENQIIYFKADVTSTQVTVIDTYVISCSSTWASTSTSLFTGGAARVKTKQSRNQSNIYSLFSTKQRKSFIFFFQLQLLQHLEL